MGFEAGTVNLVNSVAGGEVIGSSWEAIDVVLLNGLDVSLELPSKYYINPPRP